MLINGADDDDDDELGFAPLLSIVTPIATAAGADIANRIGTRFGGGAPPPPPPPPCGFWQKVKKLFGADINCTG